MDDDDEGRLRTKKTCIQLIICSKERHLEKRKGREEKEDGKQNDC